MDLSRRQFFRQLVSRRNLETLGRSAVFGLGGLLKEEFVPPSLEEVGLSLHSKPLKPQFARKPGNSAEAARGTGAAGKEQTPSA